MIGGVAALSEEKKAHVILVTLEKGLHGARGDIAKQAPSLTVTTPAFLREQIRKQRKRGE